ncbi:hypothetical protein QEH59_17995 [Coraliomargarita sp. SDUM461004]|uniref:Uncharacterized protein n=1 Tax=Thalassobacterium sedimentorum TaxID=3041258 RepID=A0ABU1ANG5_9BACT|nr:hypothetical protein [Coraliomargarita sp. SDUM461004]MDQ8196333.1 hypothetical protein [Coraliomargarita sp. SDUM461004]
MKNLKLILLLQAFVFGVLSVNADDDCCADGSDPSYECEDGTLVCDASECPSCTIDNPNAETEGYECCDGEEYDPNVEHPEDEGITYTYVQPASIENILAEFDISISGEGTYTLTDLETGKSCCSDSIIDYKTGSSTLDVKLEHTSTALAIPIVSNAIKSMDNLPLVEVRHTGELKVTVNGGGTSTQSLNDGCEELTGVLTMSTTVNAGINVEVDTDFCFDCPELDEFDVDHTGNLSGSLGISGAYTPTDLADTPSVSDFSGSLTGNVCFNMFVDLPAPVSNININRCWPSSI